MIAVFCSNDRCPQFVASHKRRFIGERDHERARWAGFCLKCRTKIVIEPAVLQTAT